MKSSSSILGIIITVVGIVLIIAGGSYALYERYVVTPPTHLSKLAFNPIVDALGIIGVILLIAGITMYYRMKSQPAPTKPSTQSTSSGLGQSGGTTKPGSNIDKKGNAPTS